MTLLNLFVPTHAVLLYLLGSAVFGCLLGQVVILMTGDRAP